MEKETYFKLWNPTSKSFDLYMMLDSGVVLVERDVEEMEVTKKKQKC